MRVLRQRVRLVVTAEVASGCKTALAVQGALSFSLCHPLEHDNLSKEVSFRLSRAPKHFSAWNQIRHDARLRSDSRTLTDPKMPGHRRLPADADEIFQARLNPKYRPGQR